MNDLDAALEEWGDYESRFHFPSYDQPCTCEHDTVDHDYVSCAVKDCPCLAYWEHE